MSLIRQVWLLLLSALLLALAGGLVMQAAGARHALQVQLDALAAAQERELAATLAQQQIDRERVSRVLAVRFDNGPFLRLKFIADDGSIWFERHREGKPDHAPAWFSEAMAVSAPAATAAITDGTRGVGSLSLVVNAAPSTDMLWQSVAAFAGGSLLLVIVLAASGAYAMHRLGAPLQAAVRQARALIDGRMLTAAEPGVRELDPITQAMNAMVQRLRQLFDAQALQVEALRRQAHGDALTGLANRLYFLGQLDAALEREDGPAEGGLMLLRLIDLAGINRDHGHDIADRAILAIAQALQVYPERVAGCFLGRLNGADFALSLPVPGVAAETAQAVADALRATLPAFGAGIAVCIGSIEVARGMRAATVLGMVDAALAGAESKGPFAVEHASAAAAPAAIARGERAWRGQISAALDDKRVRLVEFAVVDRDGRTLHLECPLRVQLEADGVFEPAARWLPLALRGRLTPRIDLQAVSLALDAIDADRLMRCVNLSPASLALPAFASALAELLRGRSAAAMLSVEFAEGVIVEQFDALQSLSRALHGCGTQIGLEHAGKRLAQTGRLFEAGLDYVKLDASLTRGVAGDPRAAEFVRTTVKLLRDLSLKVHAEGVIDRLDADALWALGVDGLTGPWIGERTGAAR